MRDTDKSCEFLFVRCFAAIPGQHLHRQLQLHAPNRLSMPKEYGIVGVPLEKQGNIGMDRQTRREPEQDFPPLPFGPAVSLQLFQHLRQPCGGVELEAAVFVVRRDDLAQKPGKHRLGADLDKDPHLLGH